MKKNLVFLTLAALVAFTACGDKDKDGGSAATLSITGDGIATTKVITAAEAQTATVKVDIAASEGIQNLIVAINSSSPAFSGAVAGFQNADLANPSTELAATLTGLGLKNGAEVKGKTALEFDISNFVGMIFQVRAGAGETGDCTANFALTLVDNKNNSKNETIKLSLVSGEPTK